MKMHQYTENQQQVSLTKKLKWVVVKAHSSSSFLGGREEKQTFKQNLLKNKEVEFWGLWFNACTTFKNTPSSYELFARGGGGGVECCCTMQHGIIIICMVQSQGWMDLMNMSLNLTLNLDLTWPDQIREFRSVPRRCLQQHTTNTYNSHNKLFSLSHSSSVFINSMLCLPLFSDAWLGMLKLCAAEAEEVIYKQTNKQTISDSNKVIAASVFHNPLGALCVLA